MMLIYKGFDNYIEMQLPGDFSFEQCLVYIDRSEIECLHKVKGQEIYKLLSFEEKQILIKIGMKDEKMRISFLNTKPPEPFREQVAKYVWDMFDLGTDLDPFYKKGKKDEILNLLVKEYRGLRIVKINDLFEGLCWAVIGQQINLKFAYTLKKRLVEKYGEKLTWQGEDYFMFPKPEVLSKLRVEDLKELQFTGRKAEYVIGIARLFNEGNLSREMLEEEDYEGILNKLVSIKGVGAWTANYVILKCFNINCAFPIADVGIHNALKDILGLEGKPPIDEIERMARNWEGWEAYAAFYLWRSLYKTQ